MKKSKRNFLLASLGILIIGGEKFGLFSWSGEGEYRSFKGNTSCAAGTGGFLDQQAERLGLRILPGFHCRWFEPGPGRKSAGRSAGRQSAGRALCYLRGSGPEYRRRKSYCPAHGYRSADGDEESVAV